MILIIACTFFALMSLLLFSFEFTIMDSFSSLEEKYTERDLTRAYHAIEDEIEGYNRLQPTGENGMTPQLCPYS